MIESVEDGVVRGSFYDSAMDSGRINDDWGPVRFAFVTTDGTGAYYSSAVLRGDRLEGTTLSVGRDFLSVWTAKRVP